MILKYFDFQSITLKNNLSTVFFHNLSVQSVSNDELSHVMETSDEWIRERTGIRFRHVALEETTSDMAAEAAARALKNGEVNADEIELILTATSSSDVIYPSAACIVQKRIGAQNALAFDLNGACSGFVSNFWGAVQIVIAWVKLLMRDLSDSPYYIYYVGNVPATIRK